MTTLCLHSDFGSSYSKTSEALQEIIRSAENNLMFIDFPAILMTKCKHYLFQAASLIDTGRFSVVSMFSVFIADSLSKPTKSVNNLYNVNTTEGRYCNEKAICQSQESYVYFGCSLISLFWHAG